jgi:hypothetical protein
MITMHSATLKKALQIVHCKTFTQLKSTLNYLSFSNAALANDSFSILWVNKNLVPNFKMHYLKLGQTYLKPKKFYSA